MHLSKYSIFCSLILLTACLPPTQPIKKVNTFKIIEPLQLIKIEDKQLTFKVLSTGCTQENDFVINNQIVGQQCQLTIYRIKPDLCKRAALPKKIVLNWNKNTQCKDKDIQFTNPSINQNSTNF